VQGAGRQLESTTPEELDRWQGLERLAAAEGLAWASRSCEELRQQGRSVAGGWPGTLSQARLRVRACMTGGAGVDRALSRDDVDWLARTIYLTAKAEWLAQAEPGSDD
jgi:hypothetical protein